jgi:hypothetical protein
MTRTLMGRGPTATLGIVAVAALPYLAACGEAPPPPPPDTLSAAVVCADIAAQPPRRVDDQRCQTAPADPRYDWATAQLPGTDADPDPNAGGFFFAAVGQTLGPGYTRGYPHGLPTSKVARGVAPLGGTLTRFGGGTAGARSLGSKLTAPGNTQIRPGSTSITRGGLGVASSSGARGSSGGSSGS